MRQKKDSWQTALQVAILGSEKCGKTTLIRNMIGENLILKCEASRQQTTYTHNTMIHNTATTFRMIDISEDDIYDGMDKEALKKADVIIIVIRLDDVTSLEAAYEIYDRVQLTKKLPVIFVGNKTDEIRECARKDELAKRITKCLKASYLEVNLMQENAEFVLRRAFEENEILKGPYKTSYVAVKRKKSNDFPF